MTQPPEPGDHAPAFKLPATSGGAATLKEYAGKYLVLFFYPKDDTAGCTQEAIAFSEARARFTRQGAAILGISRDSIERHAAFITKHDLKVRLASDEDGAACAAYGVWQAKQLYGKTFMGIVRTTFLIGPDGVIRHVWRKVRVPQHVEAVYEQLRAER